MMQDAQMRDVRATSFTETDVAKMVPYNFQSLNMVIAYFSKFQTNFQHY